MDIVERLRESAIYYEEAANSIERLRVDVKVLDDRRTKALAYANALGKENERLRKALQCISDSSEDWGGFAEAALKEGE
jgi:hypothetical protein